MASVDATTSNYSNETISGDESFTMTTSRSDDLRPLYKTLHITRASVGFVIVSVMLISNALTLYAVWITPRLRVKAYALTTSMTASYVLLSLALIDWLVYLTLGGMTCNSEWYKTIIRPIQRWLMYVPYVHVSVIAVDRYIAVMYPLHYENRVISTTPQRYNILVYTIRSRYCNVTSIKSRRSVAVLGHRGSRTA